MPIPTLTKTWLFKNNVRLFSTGTVAGDRKQLLLAIKNTLLSTSGWTNSAGTGGQTHAAPWVVRGSSNTSTFTACPASPSSAAPGGADTWATVADIVEGNTTPTNGSWIVLRQAGVNSFFEVLIQLMSDTASSAASNLIIVRTSWNQGFTGGTLSVLPTAVDQFEIKPAAITNGGSWTGAVASSCDTILNVQMSTDGSVTRFWAIPTSLGYPTTFWCLQKTINTHDQWVDNAIISIPYYLFLGVPINANAALSVAFSTGSARVGAGAVATQLTTEGVTSLPLGEVQTYVDDISFSYPLTPIGIYSPSPSVTARIGTLTDAWFTSNATNEGDTFPGDGSKQFVTIGDLVLPWHRGAVVLV